MKECKHCRNEIPNRNVFCDNNCQQQYQNKTQIESWLNGENVTRKGGTSIPQWMRNYLLNQSNHKCTKCGWGEINPYTSKSPLDIDHIDGDAYNNLKNNLRVMCPNCHSLEKTFKNVGNRKSTRNYRNKPL